MTVDELSQVLEPRLRAMEVSLKAIEPTLAAVQASALHNSTTHGTQIDALFDARDEHARRIAAVERDYTPRKVADEHGKRINELEVSVANKVGWGMGVMAVINLIGMGGIAALIAWAGK